MLGGCLPKYDNEFQGFIEFWLTDLVNPPIRCHIEQLQQTRHLAEIELRKNQYNQ